jgi:hypothetical protein
VASDVSSCRSKPCAERPDFTCITAFSSKMSASVTSLPAESNKGTLTPFTCPGYLVSISVARSPTSGSGELKVRPGPRKFDPILSPACPSSLSFWKAYQPLRVSVAASALRRRMVSPTWTPVAAGFSAVTAASTFAVVLAAASAASAVFDPAGAATEASAGRGLAAQNPSSSPAASRATQSLSFLATLTDGHSTGTPSAAGLRAEPIGPALAPDHW